MQRRSFREALAVGRTGEKIVEQWLQSRGNGIIPCYEFSGAGDDKAPKLMFTGRGMVIPDLDVVAREGGHPLRFWAEVKNKHLSPWNRKHRANVHGFTRRLWRNYLDVERRSGCPVWLFVVEHALELPDRSEQPTGVILAARLAKLTRWPCQCPACRDGKGCIVRDPRDAWYFPRSEMRVMARLDLHA